MNGNPKRIQTKHLETRRDIEHNKQTPPGPRALFRPNPYGLQVTQLAQVRHRAPMAKAAMCNIIVDAMGLYAPALHTQAITHNMSMWDWT